MGGGARGAAAAAAAGTHATAGRLVRSVGAAVRARDPRLATLLAQANTGGHGSSLAAAQLQLWRGSPVEKYLSGESKLVFGLLAGEVAPPPPAANIKSWCQSFGLHLWYLRAPTATLARAVEGYLASVASDTAVFPAAPGSPAVDPDVSRLKDVSFNLLALASAGAAPPEVDAAVAAMFHPLTYCSADLTNAALAWHLFVALRAVGALPASAATAALADRVHVAFAQQLLAMGDGVGGVGGAAGRYRGKGRADVRAEQGSEQGRGRGPEQGHNSGSDSGDSMVEWAVYVAMHIEHGPTRRLVVRSTLHRRCADWCDDAERTSFLRRQLGVPEAWLDRARRHWVSYNWWEPETAFLR